jgi:dTDP-4-amino-4,6-dideoxygalactose transaminase
MSKSRLRELAILGGSPLLPQKLFVGCPNIGRRDRLLERINDILDRRMLTNNGPYVEELERRTAEWLGVSHSIAVCNATIGLELAIRALDLRGEVIVPSMTFIATAHALEWHGVTPIFCDIDPVSHNLDPSRVEELITQRTSGILGVHLWGRPCPTEALADLAERRGLKLLFDAAHAIGCTHRGRKIGSFGNAEVFSLHATKVLNAFEGGLITTNEDALAARLRLMRNFGFAGYDNVVEVGTNAKMSEVSAAMGLTSLESFGEFVAVNARNYNCYQDLLAGLPGLRLATYDRRERCNYQYIVCEIDERITHLSRDELVQTLWAENVIARKYFFPGCHNMPPYRERYAGDRSLLKRTAELADRIVVLPTGTTVTEKMIRDVCSIVRLAVAHGPELAARLRFPTMQLAPRRAA